jgi:hypothetical protein
LHNANVVVGKFLKYDTLIGDRRKIVGGTGRWLCSLVDGLNRGNRGGSKQGAPPLRLPVRRSGRAAPGGARPPKRRLAIRAASILRPSLVEGRSPRGKIEKALILLALPRGGTAPAPLSLAPPTLDVLAEYLSGTCLNKSHPRNHR